MRARTMRGTRPARTLAPPGCRSRVRYLWPIALVVAVTVAAGCGSKAPEGASCVAAAACGGDVAGTWQVDDECIAIASPFAQHECQQAVNRSTVTVSGTVVYTPSAGDPTTGTQQSNLTYVLSIDEIYSDACLVAIGSKGPSAAACNGLQSYWTGPYAVTCSPRGDTCECQFEDQGTIQQTDTYAIVGTQLVLASSGAVDYCRSGSSLVESSVHGISTSRLTMHLAQ